MSGLSNAGFMGGLMQGSQFVEGMQNRADANQRAGEAHERAGETHQQQTKINDLKINEAEQKVLLSDLDRDLRSMEETNKAFTKDQWKKYKALGFDKLGNNKWREENKDAGALIHRGMTTGEWDEKSLDGFNTSFYDELRKREKSDGLKRKIIGVKETNDGRMAAILEITKRDGSKYKAPLTKNATADDDDSLVVFDDKKLQEIYEVQMHRADMAHAIDKAGGDPKKLAAVMRKIAFKQESKKAPGLESVYDQNTGRDQKVVWDGSKYVPIGGNKVDYSKNSRDPRANGGGGSRDASQMIDWKEYRDKRASALKEGDPAMLDQVDAMFESTYGFTVDDFNSFRQQRAKHEIYDNPTIAETRAFVDGSKAASSNRLVENEINQNPSVFGSNQGLADQQQAEINSFAQASGDSLDSLASIAAKNHEAAQIASAPPRELALNPRIAELEALMADPKYPDGARARFEEEYNQLIAKHKPERPEEPRKLSPLAKYEQAIKSIQAQLSSTQNETEQKRLGELLVKTMTDFNSNPGLIDSAHMAAL